MFIKIKDIGEQHDRELRELQREIEQRQANIEKALSKMKAQKED